MVETETLALGAISAAATVAVHEWLHNNPSFTEQLPSFTDGLGANVGSVSVGLAGVVVVGVVINYYYWEEISE